MLHQCLLVESMLLWRMQQMLAPLLLLLLLCAGVVTLGPSAEVPMATGEHLIPLKLQMQ
jgi:hypothetical protein